MLLIAAMVGLGCLQVAQRNAVFLQALAVGERLRDLHAQENDVSWSNAHIIGLTSPLRLAQVAEERRLKLVAWLRLPPAPLLVDKFRDEKFAGVGHGSSGE